VDLAAFAGLAGACPSIFDARQALAVEVCGALGTSASAKHLGVEHSEDEKERRKDKQPPRGEGTSME
jgi:hypothetical protein